MEREERERERERASQEQSTVRGDVTGAIHTCIEALCDTRAYCRKKPRYYSVGQYQGYDTSQASKFDIWLP